MRNLMARWVGAMSEWLAEDCLMLARICVI
jgi:hypothetical protein